MISAIIKSGYLLISITICCGSFLPTQTSTFAQVDLNITSDGDDMQNRDLQSGSSAAATCEDLSSDSVPTNGSAMLNVLPPEITMVYEGKEYQGELTEAKYREGETINDLQPPPFNTTTNLPANTVNISRGSCVEFVIKGTPSTLPPNSLDVSAYAMDNTPVAVLDASEDDSSTFQVSLDSGAYVLLATATWDPTSEDEDVGGYVIYNFLVNITGM